MTLLKLFYIILLEAINTKIKISEQEAKKIEKGMLKIEIQNQAASILIWVLAMAVPAVWVGIGIMFLTLDLISIVLGSVAIFIILIAVIEILSKETSFRMQMPNFGKLRQLKKELHALESS